MTFSTQLAPTLDGSIASCPLPSNRCGKTGDAGCVSISCETAGLEQLRARGILEVPGASDESSQCLLFMFADVVVLLLPQFELDALLLFSFMGMNLKPKQGLSRFILIGLILTTFGRSSR